MFLMYHSVHVIIYIYVCICLSFRRRERTPPAIVDINRLEGSVPLECVILYIYIDTYVFTYIGYVGALAFAVVDKHR